MRTGCLEQRTQEFIEQKRRLVFLRSDFEVLAAGYDQIGRAIRKLVKKGKLVRVGYGLYTKTKKSQASGKFIPKANLQKLGYACLKRLNVITAPSRAEVAYNQGKSTQVPTGRVIAVKGRVTRKIGYNGILLTFEKIRRKLTQ
jgi:hypothetical protein